MSPATPITQRHVAEACGLHPSTVCLALRNSPSIPEETRRRVHAMADSLGYQPNAAARRLALLRTERNGGGGLPLVWLNQEPRRDHWRTDPEAALLLAGARARADELGYSLEEVWAREPGMTAARLEGIIGARGVEGVILPAHRVFDFSLLDPRWSSCALIGCNDLRFAEWIDVVCADHAATLRLACRELRRGGAERIGLLLTQAFELATDGLVHGAFLHEQAAWTDGRRVPPQVVRPDEGGLAEWLALHSPDAIICSDRSLAEAGEASHPDLTWVSLADAGNGALESVAGRIGALAVDRLVEKIRGFERGRREVTRVHLIRGGWSRPAAALHPSSAVA